MGKNTQSQEIKLCRLKDQMLASLLYATGQTLDSTEWENGVCYFVFENRPKCEAIIADYYKGQITLNCKVIFDAIKTIKGILFSK